MFTRFLNRPQSRRPRGAQPSLLFRPALCAMEDRCVPSAAVPKISPNAPILTNLPAAPEQVVSTVPANGDVNPYGMAFVPEHIENRGVLNPGDLLISNFNDSANVQGTGTTIVRITPQGQRSVFFQGNAGLGLTTALTVLKSGYVIVGNLPTDANGNPQQGSLLILNSKGQIVLQLSNSKLLDGPWDMAVNDQDEFAQLFVSNVLSGTVTRIDLRTPDQGSPSVIHMTQIASGYAHRLDPNALVVGPTGLAYDAQRDILYVASTGDNEVFAIRNASRTSDHGMGTLVYKDATHLHGPLGLVLAPNGDLIAANGDAVNPDANHPNELVEFTTNGKFVGQFQVDPGAPGGAFGVAVTEDDGVLRFAAVDDDANTADIWTIDVTHGRSRDG